MSSIDDDIKKMVESIHKNQKEDEVESNTSTNEEANLENHHDNTDSLHTNTDDDHESVSHDTVNAVSEHTENSNTVSDLDSATHMFNKDELKNDSNHSPDVTPDHKDENSKYRVSENAEQVPDPIAVPKGLTTAAAPTPKVSAAPTPAVTTAAAAPTPRITAAPPTPAVTTAAATSTPKVSAASASSTTESKNKWNSKSFKVGNKSVKTYYISNLDETKLGKLLALLDKEIGQYLGSDDVFVVNSNLIIWFSASKYQKARKLRTGGGLIAGIWEIENDEKEKKLSFRVEQPNGSANNLLEVGNGGSFGFDFKGKYPNKKISWGLETTEKIKETSKSGKSLGELKDSGAYASDNGMILEFEAGIANHLSETSPREFKASDGFKDKYDTNPDSNSIGTTDCTVNYRIPENKPEFILTIICSASNSWGPISSAGIYVDFPSPDSQKFEIVASPRVMLGSKGTDLSAVELNKYFTNSCVKELYFYDMSKSKSNQSHAVKTPPGRGQLLGLGAPRNNVSYLVGYPNTEGLNPEFNQEFYSTLERKKHSDSSSFYHKLVYTTGDNQITVSKDKPFVISERFKVIDASAAVPPSF